MVFRDFETPTHLAKKRMGYNSNEPIKSAKGGRTLPEAEAWAVG